MERYILDTNLFFNMEPGLGLGTKTEEVIVKVTQAIRNAKNDKAAEFFMPPRVVDELLSFFEDKKQPFLKEFLGAITVKSPEQAKLDLPASIFYKLVDDIRTRSYRGLNIAEEEAKNLAELLNGQTVKLSKIELEKTAGKITTKLRERYRQATRQGFLDSVADLDLIMLAKELDAVLVSTDEGVIAWGRKFGVREMSGPAFGSWLGELLQ